MTEKPVMNASSNGVPVVEKPLIALEQFGDETDSSDVPYVGKYSDGTWGPTGLYCGRIKETRLLSVLRGAVRPSRLARIENVLLNRCKRVHCLFENLSDPANGAACLRTIESFGLSSASAVERYETFRVSDGITKSAHKWINVSRYRHCLDAVRDLKSNGYTLVATALDDDSVPLESVDFSGMNKIALMFGNEERGLSKALRQEADVKVAIEMKGFTESFNISVSCALMLMHLRHKGIIQPDLNDDEITEFYNKWLLLSTKKTMTLLKRHNLEDEVPEYL